MMLLATLRELTIQSLSLLSGARRKVLSRRPSRTPLLLELLEDRSLLSANPLTSADFRNPPNPIGTVFSTDANVNTDVEGAIHDETTIAVNPTNPLNMIASANDVQGTLNGGGQVYLTFFPRARVTFDGGQTWTTYAIPFPGYNQAGDPSVSFDADGTAYFAGYGLVVSQNDSVNITSADIIVSHSTNGGQTWSAPARVATGQGTKIDNDKPYLAAWGHGNAIVTWTRFQWDAKGAFIDGPIFASVTHDAGKHWTEPVQISGSIDQTQFSSPAVAADGGVYVAFMNFDNQIAPDFRSHYEVVKVDPATGHPLGAPIEVGLIYDGVNDYPRNVDGSPTYQDSQFRTFAGGNLTADPSNALHLAVIWHDMRNSGVLTSLDPYQVQTNSDIIVSQSFDGGQTWSAPSAIVVPNDQFMPYGAYDVFGRLQIGYYDRSYDPANHKYGYTLASETTPGMLDFTFQQVTTALSDPTQGAAFYAVTMDPDFPNAATFLGDYSGIAVTPTGVAALWTDMRLPASIFPGSESFPGSGEDAFFAFVDLSGASLAQSDSLRAAQDQSFARDDASTLASLWGSDELLASNGWAKGRRKG